MLLRHWPLMGCRPLLWSHRCAKMATPKLHARRPSRGRSCLLDGHGDAAAALKLNYSTRKLRMLELGLRWAQSSWNDGALSFRSGEQCSELNALLAHWKHLSTNVGQLF
mmetsp:Transcript_113444/g.360644  ORF Transcript_113444/g.360644 Transcript_113444/m.360644 type:complete len:109 (+) Transcript_113444:636-962(+)